MLEHNFSYIDILNTRLLINNNDMHSFDTRLSLLEHNQVATPVRLATGYLKIENHIIAVYNFDDCLHPSPKQCDKKQIILLLKYQSGLFGVICNDVLPLKAQVELFTIPESMDVKPSLFSHYAKVENKIYPVANPAAVISYLDNFTQRLATKKSAA